jgi:hypothetical protein
MLLTELRIGQPFAVPVAALSRGSSFLGVSVRPPSSQCPATCIGLEALAPSCALIMLSCCITLCWFCEPCALAPLSLALVLTSVKTSGCMLL